MGKKGKHKKLSLALEDVPAAKETWATNIADMDISDDEGAKKKPAGADKEADEGMEVDAKPAGNMFSMLTDADGSDPKEILAKNKHMLGTKKGVKKAMKLGVKVSLTGKRGNATRKQGEHKRSAAIKGMAFNEKHSTKLSKKASRVRLREKLKNLY